MRQLDSALMVSLLAALVACPSALAADPPTFSVQRGVFDAPFSLSLTPAAATDTLYCSFDHSDPVTVCSLPIAIDNTTIVRARAVAEDGVRRVLIDHRKLGRPRRFRGG